MAISNLFIRSRRTIGGIQLDAVIRESHTNEVQLTQNPIETGALITDHAIVKPKTLFIIAHVSDHLIGSAAFGQIIDFVTGLFGTSTTQNLTRSNTAYNALVQVLEARELIEVQTKLKLYTNMLITSIATIQDKDSSTSVTLNIQLEEALLTESQVVRVSPNSLSPGRVREQAASALSSGKKAALNALTTDSSSVLKTITGWLF